MSFNLKAKRGFSLLEVVIALTILLLVSGSIYSVLRGSIDTAATMRESQARQEQVDGFLELVHSTFHQLPAHTMLESRLRKQDGRLLPELIFYNSPEVLSWGNTTDLKAVSVLGLKPEIGGGFSLALLRYSPGKNQSGDPVASAKAGDWLTLVPDVKRVSWRFFERNTNAWLPLLPRGSARPGAVEMVLELADFPRPIRMVFGIVPLAPPSNMNQRQRVAEAPQPLS